MGLRGACRLYQASFKRGVSPAARRNTASARASPSPRHRDATHSPARSDRVSQLANDYSVGDLTADLVGELSVGELSVAQLPAHHHRDQPSSPNRPDATIPLPQRRDQSVDAQTDGPSSPLGAANQVKAGLLASPARPAGAGGPRGAHGGRPQFLRALSPVLRKELEYPHGPYRHQAYPVAMPDVYQTRDMDRVRQVGLDTLHHKSAQPMCVCVCVSVCVCHTGESCTCIRHVSFAGPQPQARPLLERVLWARLPCCMIEVQVSYMCCSLLRVWRITGLSSGPQCACASHPQEPTV